jgi:hypothetical protein
MAGTGGADVVYVETAGGLMELPAGLPDWVTADLVAQANAAIAPPQQVYAQEAPYVDPEPLNPDAGAAATPPAQGGYIQTPYGPVYVAPGQPDWVTANLIDQLAQAPPGSAGPPRGATNIAPPPPPLSPSAPPPQGEGGGGLKGAAQAAIDAARRIAAEAGQQAGRVADAAGDAAARLAGTVKGVIDSLVPTVQELALGLTHRFAELAGFIADKTVSVGEYAGTMAAHAASAMSEVLADAWHWIVDALMHLGSLLGKPLEAILEGIFTGVEALEHI